MAYNKTSSAHFVGPGLADLSKLGVQDAWGALEDVNPHSWGIDFNKVDVELDTRQHTSVAHFRDTFSIGMIKVSAGYMRSAVASQQREEN